MTVTSTPFTGRVAPCGKRRDGEVRESHDGQGLVSEETLFDCGCRIDREEYHDGSIEHDVIRHDGRLLEHETIAEHGA